MSDLAPEFSRPVSLDSIGEPREAAIEASEAERAALVRRFGLSSLDRLTARYRLTREGASVMAEGRVEATLAQPCVATGEPVVESIDAPFTIRFEPEGSPDAEEVELSDEECDIVFYTGGRIDMGEAVAETLALSITPWPRHPDADAHLRDMGVLSEEEAGPFAALAKLKRK